MALDHKVDKSNLAVRMALLKCYQGKCALSDEAILDDLDIDHIIPASLAERPAQLRDYLARLQLAQTFELDSLLNLIPVKRKRNRQKSNTPPSEVWARFLLERAANLAPKVLEEIQNFRRSVTIGQAKEVIREHLQESGIDSEAFVENLYDSLLDEDTPFPEDRDQWEDDGLAYYSNSKPSIRLEARLPTLRRPGGACRIVFRSLRARNTTIVLDHAQIVHSLFQGLNTEPHHNLRGFMAEEVRSDGGCRVVLGNTRLPLKAEEIGQLCDVVDDFGSAYVKPLRAVDDLVRAHEFARSTENRRGYRLITVKRELWNRMIEFACRHDVSLGTSPWHMFDWNGYYVKVFHAEKTERYDDDYHMFFHPEPVSEDYPWGDEIWVVGEVLMEVGGGPATVDSRRYWDVETGYRWLTEEFIPEVVAHYGLNGNPAVGLRRLVSSISNWIFKHDVEKRADIHPLYSSGRQSLCPPPEAIRSVRTLRRFAEHLQEGWHRPGSDFLTTAEVRNLYSAVSLCLERTDEVDYPYVRNKLPFNVEETSGDKILEAVRWHAEHDEGAVFPNLWVDCALRCIVVSLRDGEPRLTSSECERIARWLSPLYERVDRWQVLERSCPDYPSEVDDWGEVEETEGVDLEDSDGSDSGDER